MEGTPFIAENNAETPEERRRKEAAEKREERKAKKPEALGILAVESPSEEPELSPLEKAIADSKRSIDESKNEPAPEAEMPVERVPEEQAHEIVRNMVRAKEQDDAEAVEHAPDTDDSSEDESDPEPESAPKPEPEAAPEAAIEEPIEIPEVAAPPAEEEPVPEAEITAEIPKKKPEEESADTEQEAEETPAEGPKFQFNEAARTQAVEEDEPAPEIPIEKPKVEAKPVPDAEVEEHEEDDEDEPKPAPKRIGHMLVTTEAAPAERRPQPVAEVAASSLAAEEKMKVETSPIEPVSGKRIDTLNRTELMELGEKIDIDGNNLRHMYETQLIGERGLRRLIAEHLQGGDLRRALRREVMEREMDFERDPVMRDLPLSVSATTTHDNGIPALEKLLKNADVSLADNGEKTAFFKAQAKYETSNSKRHHQQRRIMDISLVVVIACLVVMAIFIYFGHG